MTTPLEMRSEFDDLLSAAVAPWGLVPTPRQLDQMWHHFEMMVEANRTMNLTRITAPADAAIKHLADSLALCPWADQVGVVEARVLDVGTGAGFPGVPLAVMRPAWRVTAIDGTGKKIAFVKAVAAALGLPNLRADAVHADHWKTHQRFDIVIARAVGAVAKCLPFAARLTAPGGWFVSYKTPDAGDAEIAQASTLARELQMIRYESFDYCLTTADETLRRRLVVFHQP